VTPLGDVATIHQSVVGRAPTLPRCGTGDRRSIRFRTVALHAEPGDAALVDALRGGDERAFARLVDKHHSSLLRVAGLYVRDRAVAEEVVQETWLAVLEGIDRFEARSSLKTWIFRILTNRAKTRGQRERRQLPFSALVDDGEPEVDEARFHPIDDPKFPQHWAVPPRAWPHERILARETVEQVREAVAQLPATQQLIVGLRDIDGWSSDEVCEALEITPGNQRVLLHRARSRLRNVLEDYFEAR
jgi:RNA polymerase sigma-70 factor, ECF subfamily